MGRGWEYLNQVMRLIWDGTVINYDQGTHIRDAIQRAGIDADKLLEDVDKNPAKYDALLERNEEVQKDNTAGHTGVPLFVYAHEPFFGRDRMRASRFLVTLVQFPVEAAEFPVPIVREFRGNALILFSNPRLNRHDRP